MKEGSEPRRRSGLLARVLGHGAGDSSRHTARPERGREQSSIDEGQDVDVRLLDSLMLHDGAKKDSSLVEKLEKKTKQTVSIETSTSEPNLRKCHAQTQSSLFQLPAELRELIWEFLATPLGEPSIGYQDAYPEMRRQQKFTLNISKTCRLAWLETNGIAMRQAQHRFWLDLGDGPKEFLAEFKNAWIVQAARNDKEKRARAAAASELRFAQNLTVNNRLDLQEIRIFATDFWLREKFPPLMPLFTGYNGICPMILSVCISAYSFNMSMKYDTWHQKQWLARLLNQPALSKLRELHLQIESEVHGERETTKQLSLGLRVDEIRMLTSKLRALVCRPFRVEDGSWRQFVMQEPVETKDWDTVHGRLDSARHFGIEGRRSHRVTNVAWKSVPVPAPVESASANSYWLDTYIERTSGPKDGLNRAAKQIVQRWSDEQSLLKFA